MKYKTLDILIKNTAPIWFKKFNKNVFVLEASQHAILHHE